MRKPARIAWLALLLAAGGSAFAADEGPYFSAELIEKGERLAVAADCQACHTDIENDGPAYAGGRGLDTPFGVIYTPNLTPDAETGLGKWSDAEIITAFTTGVRPDGRQLSPAMPWVSYAHITADDAAALAAYLRSLKPVEHKVPGPFAAGDKPTAPYHSVVAPK